MPNGINEPNLSEIANGIKPEQTCTFCLRTKAVHISNEQPRIPICEYCTARIRLYGRSTDEAMDNRVRLAISLICCSVVSRRGMRAGLELVRRIYAAILGRD